jgi:protein arginine N-methyltransferase 5
VFTFRHLPYPDDPEKESLPQGENQNLRCYDCKSFKVLQNRCEIHGFGGYFTAELYQSVFYSIEPSKHTSGMHSWFPMFFPIKTPLLASKGQEIRIQIWRNNSQ